MNTALTTRLNVRVLAQLASDVRRKAEQNNTTLSEVIRAALEQYLSS